VTKRNKKDTSLRGNYASKVPVNKIFIEQKASEPKVIAFIPMYELLEVSKCQKCGKVIS
jgi:hypothetical protein